MDHYRDLTAIKDKSVKYFIESLKIEDFLYNKHLIYEFKENFVSWINSSKNNHFENLNSFKNVQITNGSVHTFDHFYLKHKNKVFRTAEGEFMYHHGALKHDYTHASPRPISIPISILDSSRYPQQDHVFIISVPFTAYGKIHDNFFECMDMCEEHKIPVLLDFCHAPVSKNIRINLDDYSCIETLSFSISKPFYGGENLRVGIRFQRKNEDDGIDILNSKGIEMLNLVGIGIANQLITHYDFDYNWNTYGKIYSEICDELNLTETDNILYAIGGTEYDQYKRAGVNRICLSNEITKRL